MRIWAYIGPGSYLAKASVEVIDSKGKVVGTGQTGSRGALLLTVPGSASENEPYMIVSSGGMVDGVPFQGHLKAFVPKLGFSNITYLDPISTTALKMSANSPRTYAANMAKVRNVLGLRYYDDMGVMRLRTSAIGAQELKVKIEQSGGLTKFTDVLAEAAEKGQVIDGLKPAKSSRLPASNGTRAAASTPTSNPACSIDYNAPNPSSGPKSLLSWSTIYNLGYNEGRSLITGWVGNAAVELIEKVPGFAIAKGNSGPDMTSAQINQNFIAIAGKLDCITAQVSDLENALGEVKLEVKLVSIQSCIDKISAEYESYNHLLSYFEDKKSKAYIDYLDSMFNPDHGTTVKAMDACGSLINQTLFNTGGSNSAAWITEMDLIQNKKVGSETIKVPNVFLPSDIYQLQLFLSYYSNLQYQQIILWSELFNYNINILGKEETEVAKFKMYGDTCTTSSIPQNPPKGSASNFCDWQLNIAGVWPQTIFSDEVALCTECDKSFPILTGYAIVAVPAKLANELISPYRDVKLGGRNEGLGGRSSESLAKNDPCNGFAPPEGACGGGSVITLKVAPVTGVAEDGPDNLIFTFSRTGPTTSALIVNFSVGGSATLGTDYTGIAAKSATKSVTFAAGSSTATVTVVPTADATIEPDETVALTLSTATGYSIGTTSAVVGIILNDDFPKSKLISTLVSPYTLAQDCISAGNNHNCGYSMPLSQASDTLKAFNQYTVDSPSDMNQETWSTRLVKRDGVATSDQLTAISGKGNENNLFYVGSFLSSWLNHSNGVPNYSAPAWTLLKANTTLNSNFHDVTTRQCSTIDNKPVCSDITTYTATVSMGDGVYNPGNPGYNFTPCNNSTKSCDAGKFPSTPTAAYLLQRSWTTGTGYNGPTK